MKFSSLIVLASVVVSTFATTPAQVLDDIANMTAQVTTLDTSITNLRAGSLLAALSIHSNAVALISTINKGTADALAVTPIPVSGDDGNSILAALLTVEPIIEHALATIVTKKPIIQALPIGGIPALVKQDLANLNASTSAFESALIAAAPSTILDIAVELQGRVNVAFATAIAAFA